MAFASVPPLVLYNAQGDTPLFYKLPLRWLHVKGCGYTQTCVLKESTFQIHLANNISSAAFAEDLLCPTGDLHKLKVQASKLTLYSNWAALIISGSKTKVTGSLNASPPKDDSS